MSELDATCCAGAKCFAVCAYIGAGILVLVILVLAL